MSTTGENAGKYAVKLRLEFRAIRNGKKVRVDKRYPTDVYLTEEDYKVLERSKRTDLVAASRKLFSLRARAADLIERYSIRTPESFELFFFAKEDLTTVKSQFAIKIDLLKKKGGKRKISTIKSYETTLASLTRFSHSELTFQEVTPVFLQGYEDWNIANGRRSTTVAIYCRNIRHVFKIAIKNKLVSPDAYPFGVDRYRIPDGEGRPKQFLTVADKDRFVNYQPKNEFVAEWFDYAIFDYYCYGVNFADLARLRYPQIGPKEIEFQRSKTSKGLKVVIHPRMREVLTRRALPVGNGLGYVFPILRESMTDEQEFYVIKDFIKKTNEVLSIIEKELGLPVKLRTYTLRHTFSHVFLQNGGTLEQLQSALAHQKKETTEHYTHGFEYEIMKSLSDKQ